MKRQFAFLHNLGASVAMETDRIMDGHSALTITFAICNLKKGDKFNKELALRILNGRLDQLTQITHRHGWGRDGMAVRVNYMGRRPLHDVFYPVLDSLRDDFKKGRKQLKIDQCLDRAAKIAMEKNFKLSKTKKSKVAKSLPKTKLKRKLKV